MTVYCNPSPLKTWENVNIEQCCKLFSNSKLNIFKVNMQHKITQSIKYHRSDICASIMYTKRKTKNVCVCTAVNLYMQE